MWFKRNKEGILTSTSEKKETPEGLWYKCPSCKEIMPAEDHESNFWVCKACSHHEKIGSNEYFQILFDEGKYKLLDEKLKAVDALGFKDTKKYADRLKHARQSFGLMDAMQNATG